MQAPDKMQKLVDDHRGWYHSMDIAPGVATHGWCDLRGVVDQMPWPDVRGKRCLDIGTFDGFYAFELERRGAAEVVAVDIEDLRALDWPTDFRHDGLAAYLGDNETKRPDGFRLARELKGSSVEWRASSVYDLHPDHFGHFDVVVLGSILLHLQNPVKALEAVRSVTSGSLLSSDQIELSLTLRSRRKPLFTLNGSGAACQWFNFNAAGHERMLYAAGFEVVQRSKPFIVHTEERSAHPWQPRQVVRRGLRRYLTGSTDSGVLHQSLLGKPRL